MKNTLSLSPCFNIGKKYVLVLIFNLCVCFAQAQLKFYQQKNSELGNYPRVDGTLGSNPKSAGVLIDFDNDGIKDLIIPTYFDKQGSPDVYILRFFKNMGNGILKDYTDSIKNPDISSGKYLQGYGDYAGVCLDYNKDGKMDFVFPSMWENQDYSTYDQRFGFVKMRDYFYKDNPATYLETRANGGFQSMPFYYNNNGVFKKGYDLFDTKTFAVNRDVVTSDINKDGWPDILIFQSGYKLDNNNIITDWLGGITIWINDSGKRFKFNHLKFADSINKYTFGPEEEGKLSIADYNNDGYSDILIYGKKVPYKARTDISKQQQDSVLWDANFITTDTSRKIVAETRIYLSNKGSFNEDNYIIVPNLRATFPNSYDVNNDGLQDIFAIWKNYRGGGYNGVYIDSLTNKNGINNQYYVYINKGNNQFEDQTSKYFPYDSTKFTRLGRADFSMIDLDGDGFKDFIPTTGGDDTLSTQYGAFAIDPPGGHATMFYKNFNGQYFKKMSIDSFPKVLGWKQFPILKNLDSMYNQFYTKYYSGNDIPPKAEFLLDEIYYLNRIYIDDLNGDGKNEMIGIDGFNNRVQSFLYDKYNYRDSLINHFGISLMNQCETPRFNKNIFSTCGTDLPTTHTIKVLNYNFKDTIFWNYNGKITKVKSDSLIVKDFGWVTAYKKDSSGCISYLSDTIIIKRSIKPTPPRVYFSGNTSIDIKKVCQGDSVQFSADPQSIEITGKIKWFNNKGEVTPLIPGGVSTLFESAGTRNITTTSKIKSLLVLKLYTIFESTEGCLSDTSNIITPSSFNNPNFSLPTFNTSKFSFCNGDSIKLSITNVNKGDTLKWYFGTKSDLTNVSSKTFSDSSKVFVTRTDSLGCMISSDTIQLKKYAIPGSPSLVRDSVNNLVASTNGITWYKDGVKIADTTQKIKPTTNGLYTATTTQNGCTSALCQGYYYLTNAVANLSNGEYFKVSPNPTNGEVFFNYNIRSSKEIYISVVDINGRTVLLNKKVESGSRVNLGAISKGNYIIQVKDGAGRLIASQKLVKE